MSIKLDLTKFKHVKTEGNLTTLRHKDGHVLSLAHNFLSKDSQAQLSALSKLSQSAATPDQANASRDQKMAEGGKPKSPPPGDWYKDKIPMPAPDKQPGNALDYKQIRQEKRQINHNESKKPKFAEGGQTGSQVPVPAKDDDKQPDKSLADDRAKMREDAASNNVNQGASTLDMVKNRVMNAWAEGGRVKLAEGTPDIGGVQQITGQPNAAPAQPIDQTPEYQNLLKHYQARVAPGSPEEAVGGTPEERAFKDYSTMQQLKDAPDSMSQYHRGIAQKVADIASPQPAPVQQQQPSIAPTQAEVNAQPADQAPEGMSQDEIDTAPALESGTDSGPISHDDAPLNQDGSFGRTPSSGDTAPSQGMTPEEHADATKQAFAQEDKAWEQDLKNQHVSPKTYADLFAKNPDGSDRGTLSRIGMGFAALLGGMGGGLTHTPSAFMAMMNNEIQNDLQAQTTSKANAQNYLRLGQQALMNHAQINSLDAETALKADALARMHMNRSVLHSLIDNFNAMPDGTAEDMAKKQQTSQMLAMIAPSIDNENYSIADRATAELQRMKMLFGDQAAAQGQMQHDPNAIEKAFQKQTTGLRMLGPQGEARAKDMEAKHLPGFPGLASVEIPQETRAEAAAMVKYDEKAREYVNFAKQHSLNWANLDPISKAKIANQGAAMGANLQSIYRSKIKGGVFKKGEQEYIQQIIPDQPASWSAGFNAIPKVAQTIRDNQGDLNNVAHSVGLANPSAPSAQQSPPMNQNSQGVTGQDGRMYIPQMINGKQYMVPQK